MLKTGDSYLETAVQFDLNNPSLIVRWLKAFREQGIEGLKAKSKARLSMSCHAKQPAQTTLRWRISLVF